MKNKKKLCEFCKKPYKRCAEVIQFHGTFCLHDDKLELYQALQGVPVANNSVGVKLAKDGHNTAEKRYIEKESRRGNTVVRGSDGILRSVTSK